MTVLGYNNSSAVYIGSSKFCEPKRIFRCWNKVERKRIQEQQPNQLHCSSQNMGLVNRMDQNMAKYRVGIQMKKKGGGPGLFEWCMLLFKVCGCCIVLAKMTTIILCLFWISEKMLSMQFF